MVSVRRRSKAAGSAGQRRTWGGEEEGETEVGELAEGRAGGSDEDIPTGQIPVNDPSPAHGHHRIRHLPLF